jgi:vesicle-fusing ATPase
MAANRVRVVNLTYGRTSNDKWWIWQNLCVVSPMDFPGAAEGQNFFLELRRVQQGVEGEPSVVTCRISPDMEPGHIFLNLKQRVWLKISERDDIRGRIYDPLAQNRPSYLVNITFKVGWASMNRKTTGEIDQDQLAEAIRQELDSQIFQPGQLILFDFRSTQLLLNVKSVVLGNGTPRDMESGSQPSKETWQRGLFKQTTVAYFEKDGQDAPELSASSTRPATDLIISPDFKFEDMGIGGLANEFQVIFRRAFASRVFPPAVVKKLGIKHVKGILLHGPPGTGKTLMARQIAKMLNSAEPKIVNGPEILNKYVGQSEENIRKLFADAEADQKKNGEKSKLHIIIFDEFDAICKRRGSGSGGGTGVGDTVVNQLLSKIDGVDQLENVLIIGMTNRPDMIDEALLRPGRLEVKVEIHLPDENGRLQIFNIATANMQKHNLMDRGVDLHRLAFDKTKNFSGAEIVGLVNAATSYAFMRHTKDGTTTAVEKEVMKDLKVMPADFENALNDVQSAYGVSEEDLQTKYEYGIIPFSPLVGAAVRDGASAAGTVKNSDTRLFTVLLHGPRGSGKTALAAYIASKANFPFVKMITPEYLTGFRDELGRKERIHEMFTDA